MEIGVIVLQRPIKHYLNHYPEILMQKYKPRELSIIQHKEPWQQLFTLINHGYYDFSLSFHIKEKVGFSLCVLLPYTDLSQEKISDFTYMFNLHHELEKINQSPLT